jgi:hypothetical protein
MQGASSELSAADASDSLAGSIQGALCGVHPEVVARFVCVRCGTFGCASCAFSTVPSREVCAACAAKGMGEPIPWERRRELGNWRAYWRTTRAVLQTPTAFFRTPTTQPSVVAAVVHGVLSSTIGAVLTNLVTGLLLGLGGGAVALLGSGNDANVIGAVLGGYGCLLAGMSPLALVAAPMNALIAILIAAAGSHGLLVLFKKARGSFEDSLRALSYADAPYAWSWVPLLGAFTYFWTIGMDVVALRETHRCGTDWAVAAALVYRVLLLGIVLGFYVLMLGSMLALDMAGSPA